MSGSGGANLFTLANHDRQEAPWGYPATPTGGSSPPRGRAPLYFTHVLTDSGRGGWGGPSWPMEDQVVTLTGPSGLARYRTPQTRVSRLMFLEGVNPRRTQPATPEPPSPPRFRGQRQAPPEEDSTLTSDGRKAALKKLKKEIYSPKHKRFSSRRSLYYRGLARNGTPNAENGRDDDDDRECCAICLEDFESGEEVMVTPCDHMFHEDCIVPWLKSHGQCPVCRSVISDRVRQNQSSYDYYAPTWVGSNLRVDDITSMVRLVEEAIQSGRLGHSDGTVSGGSYSVGQDRPLRWYF